MLRFGFVNCVLAYECILLTVVVRFRVLFSIFRTIIDDVKFVDFF